VKHPGESTGREAVVETTGPWPFVTRKVLVQPDGARSVLHSRHHRKSLLKSEVAAARRSLLRCLWMPGELNWWIGVVFALGSSLFALGGTLTLVPDLASAWSLDSPTVNAIFFAGSIPFTTAAFLQLFQTANMAEFANHDKPAAARRVWLGWRPRDIGWLSSALQFAGTLLFNLNTFDAMLSGLNWIQQDRAVWLPDFVGSILFLVSGYLAFIETCHAHWAWKPCSLSWWITFANLLGCVAFMISAVFAFVPQHSPEFGAATVSIAFTSIGAIGFLVGSLLMLPEILWAQTDR
jgi:hypothetical protein